VANVLVTYRKSFLDDAVDRFAAAWLALTPPQLPVKKEAEPQVAADPEVKDEGAAKDETPEFSMGGVPPAEPIDEERVP